jgi:hypothetical protein
MNKNNRISEQAHDALLIEGIDKYLTPIPTLYLGGETFTPPALASFVQSHIDAITGVAAKYAEWRAAVAALTALDARVRVVEHDLKQFVIGMLGAKSPKLADFGYAPRKVAVRTPAEKLVAAAKSKATRTARHTMGPKAKLAITGLDPTGAPLVPPPVVTVEPLTLAQATPAQVAAPAARAAKEPAVEAPARA